MLTGSSSRYLKQTITLYSASGTDDNGMPTFGEGTSISCRIDSKKVKITDRDGREIVSTAQITVDGDETVTVNDKLKMPDNTYPLILAVEGFPDPDGTNYYSVIYT